MNAMFHLTLRSITQALLVLTLCFTFPALLIAGETALDINTATAKQLESLKGIGSEIAKDNRVGISVGFIFGCSSTLSAFTPILTGYMADLFGLNLAFQMLVVFAVLAAILSCTLPGKRQLVEA